jgi:hypothetical protein
VSDTWEGWHFLRQDGKLAYYADNPNSMDGVVVKPGMVFEVEGEIIPCVNGLHASKRALDALDYAPGPIVTRVQLDGQIVVEGDKAAASKRRVLWMADATRTLHLFTCLCAEEALNSIRKRGLQVDPRSERAIEVKRLWLDGKATDDELAAAWSAAWDAALSAASSAARAAQNEMLEKMLFDLKP